MARPRDSEIEQTLEASGEFVTVPVANALTAGVTAETSGNQQ